MFRNGITIGRRPFAHSVRHDLPSFVCTACQARTLATHPHHAKNPRSTARRAHKHPEPENLMGAIKQLEKQVQLMERNYVEQLRKRAAEKEIPEGDVTEDMKDKAYQSLMAPEEPTSLFLPAPVAVKALIPKKMQTKLSTSITTESVGQPQWKAVIDELESNGGFEGMSTGDVNGFLNVIEVERRAEHSPRIFEMMLKAGIEPTTGTYVRMMDGHARILNSKVVVALFEDLKARGLAPTIQAYAHLLKAYSQQKNVAAAAAAFQDMQLAGIEPNLIVYTTLIQTCVNASDFETAWQIFNLIKFKSTATAPDVKTYTLMIHACAQNSESERALDLFTDMTVRKGLVPTAQTYHSLIHACAVRTDYFNEAWKFASEMQREGIKLARTTLNVLVQACGRSGDLTRARLLVRHMMANGNPDMAPDKFTYQNLLRAYATYQAPERSHPNAAWKKGGKTFLDSAPTFIIPEGSLEKHDATTPAEKIPFYEKAILQTDREVLDEAGLIISWLRDRDESFVDTQMMNAYLEVCLAKKKIMDLKTSYKFDFMNPEIPFALKTEPAAPEYKTEQEEADAKLLAELEPPKLQRNIHTFNAALHGAVIDRDLLFARQVWSDRLDFCRTPSYWSESKRIREKMDFMAEKSLIDVLAKSDLLGEALERATILANDAGIRWKFTDLQTLYVKAVQRDDPATARAVRVICKMDIEKLPE